MKKYYVLCHSGLVTGGSDALHQLVFYLNNTGRNATIVYCSGLKNKNKCSIPESYGKYVKTFKNRLPKDDVDNIIIIPETKAYYAKLYKKSQVYIWWLSVNNFYKTNAKLTAKNIIKNFIRTCAKCLFYPKQFWIHYKEVIAESFYNGYVFSNERKNVTHLCASYYALDFINKHSTNDKYKFIEPISKYFLDKYEELKNKNTERKGLILYNPIKSGEFIEMIKNKDCDLKFFPLRGLSQGELIEYYKKAKLYVDFGPFPGAERMPKEAVLFGCNIITGRFGASAFYEDVPILEKYKIDVRLETKENIVKRIQECLFNYENDYNDFDEYRNTVLNLEKNFIESINKIFVYV